jgi:hypothetical protein
MPAALPKARVANPAADSDGRLQAGGQRGEKLASGDAPSLRRSERGRHHLRRDVAEVRTVHVAHRYGRDLVAVQQRCADARQTTAPDDGGFVSRCELAGNGLHLCCLVPMSPGKGASQRIEEQEGNAPANIGRNVVISQFRGPRSELGTRTHRFRCHALA